MLSAVARINRRSDGEENDDCWIYVKEEVAASGEGGIDMVTKIRNRCKKGEVVVELIKLKFNDHYFNT